MAKIKAGFQKVLAFFRKIPKKTYELSAIILLAVILVVDLGYHLVSSMGEELKTAPAKLSSLSETLSLDALILRDEVPLDFSGECYLFLCEDGERVNIGTPLIEIYPDTTDADKLSALVAERSLEKVLKSAEGARLEKVRDGIVLKIEGKMLAIEKAMKSGNLSLAAKEEASLHSLMLLRERLLGTVSLDQAIKDNKDQLAELERAIGQPTGTVYADRVGWFSSLCDGYEGVLSGKDPTTLDQTALLSLFDEKPTAVPKAKLILSHKTYAVSAVSEEEARSFSLNKSYTVTLDGASLSLLLNKTVFKNQSDKVALVFSSGTLDKTVSLRRIASLSLVLRVHEGFKIPTSAIAEEDGVFGVYVLKGFRVEFREISIIYRDGNTAVCAAEFEPTDYRALSENDNVIIKGEELYDGKIVSRLS